MRYKSQLLIVTLAMTVLMAPGAPADTVMYGCFNQEATIIGTPGDDVLVGSEDTADVIVGLGGDDVIRGSQDVNASTAPGDRLCGGSGNDYIRGAVGEDRIQGGAGQDNVDGSFGYDFITQGGPGNDRVSDCDSEYTGGVRIMRGGSGADRMCLDTDNTRMYGEGGNDELIDLTCSNEAKLYGGIGRDYLESYFDNQAGDICSTSDQSDNLFGGPGTDSAVTSPNDTTMDVETAEIRQ